MAQAPSLYHTGAASSYYQPSQAPQASFAPTFAPSQASQSSPGLAGRVTVDDPNDHFFNLIQAISEVKNLRYGVKDKEVILVLGNTGAGKSTFMNYMAGRTLKAAFDERKMRIFESQDPIFEIGHGKLAHTTLPKAYTASELGLTFCDSPGFFDNRSIVQDIANAVSLRSIAEEAQKVKCILLCVEYSSVLASRGRNMIEALDEVRNFLVLDQSEDSIFFLITKADYFPIDFGTVVEGLAKDYPVIGKLHAKGRVGFYHPLDQFPDHPYVFKRADIAGKLKAFNGIARDKKFFIEREDDKGIKRKVEVSPFQISLRPNAASFLNSSIDRVQQMIISHIKSGNLNHEDLLISADDIANLFTLQNLMDNGFFDQKLKTLEEAVNAQIRLLGLHDNVGKELEELKGVLPARFHKSIDEAMQEIKKREEQAKRMKETEEKIKDCDTKMGEIKKANANLEEQLKQQKITAENYQKEIKALQEQEGRRKEEHERAMREMERLKQEQKEERDRRGREIVKCESTRDSGLDMLLKFMMLSGGGVSQAPQPSFGGFGGCPAPMMGPMMGPMGGGGDFFPGFGGGGGGGGVPARSRAPATRAIHVAPYVRRDGTHVSGYTKHIKR